MLIFALLIARVRSLFAIVRSFLLVCTVSAADRFLQVFDLFCFVLLFVAPFRRPFSHFVALCAGLTLGTTILPRTSVNISTLKGAPETKSGPL